MNNMIRAHNPATGPNMSDEDILAVALSNLIAMCEPLVNEAQGLDPEDLAMWHWARRVSAAHAEGEMAEVRAEVTKADDAPTPTLNDDYPGPDVWERFSGGY
ncbi:hypothetical protein WMF38_57740 [Sorangium sp. So ce118]